MTDPADNPQAEQVDEPPFISLLVDIIRQVRHLIRGEFALVRAEMAQIISRVLIGLLLGLLAILLVLIALTQFAASLAAGFVALGLAPVWAHLCAGLALLLVAGVLIWLASRRLRFAALIPVRSLRNLALDADIIRPLWSKEGLSR